MPTQRSERAGDSPEVEARPRAKARGMERSGAARAERLSAEQEGALLALGNRLCCPICGRLFKDPSELKCKHKFCSECIAKSLKQKASCPVCQVPSGIDDMEVDPGMDGIVSLYISLERAFGAWLLSPERPRTPASHDHRTANEQADIGGTKPSPEKSTAAQHSPLQLAQQHALPQDSKNASPCGDDMDGGKTAIARPANKPWTLSSQGNDSCILPSVANSDTHLEPFCWLAGGSNEEYPSQETGAASHRQQETKADKRLAKGIQKGRRSKRLSGQAPADEDCENSLPSELEGKSFVRGTKRSNRRSGKDTRGLGDAKTGNQMTMMAFVGKSGWQKSQGAAIPEQLKTIEENLGSRTRSVSARVQLADAAGWTCPVCTMDNRRTSVRCTACEEPRPVAEGGEAPLSAPPKVADDLKTPSHRRAIRRSARTPGSHPRPASLPTGGAVSQATPQGPCCSFCHMGSDDSTRELNLGDLLDIQGSDGRSRAKVHRQCALWAPLVYEEPSAPNGLADVSPELYRARHLKCAICHKTGAALGCLVASCRASFHLPCALALGDECRFDWGSYVMLCPDHAGLQCMPCDSALRTTPARKRRRASLTPIKRTPLQGRQNAPSAKRSRRFDQSCAKTAQKDSGRDCNGGKGKAASRQLLMTDSKGSKEDLEALATQSGARALAEWMGDEEVTHVVCGVDDSNKATRTIKYLLGILRGCWVVSEAWVTRCLEAGQLVDEEPFEIRGDSLGGAGGPKAGRLAAAKGDPPFLNGKAIYIAGSFEPGVKDRIKALATASGADLLARLSPARALPEGLLVLSDPASRASPRFPAHVSAAMRQAGLKALSYKWLLASVSCYELKPTADYVDGG